jgi:hypothetical protein
MVFFLPCEAYAEIFPGFTPSYCQRPPKQNSHASARASLPIRPRDEAIGRPRDLRSKRKIAIRSNEAGPESPLANLPRMREVVCATLSAKLAHWIGRSKHNLD